MGKQKRRARQAALQAFTPLPPPLFSDQASFLLSDYSELSVLDKISTLLTSVNSASHRISEVQLLKETISSAIHDIYNDSLTMFTTDVQCIRGGQLEFEERVLIVDGKLLKIALKALLQMDDSKEVYHLTFVQVNWFTDQLIRIIRGLEGCSNAALMTAVTRAWHVTKAAAQQLNTFLFQLFQSERTVTDFSCMILNKQILIEKLRKEPLIIALNDTTDDWREDSASEDLRHEEVADPDAYEGMSIEEIVSDIEEPRDRRNRREKSSDEVICEEFRSRLEGEVQPVRRVAVKCSQQWVERVRGGVLANYQGAFGKAAM